MASSASDLSNLAQSSTSSLQSALGNINSNIEQLFGVQRANNAASSQMAADQRDWSADQAELTRRFNSAEAEKNRQWQEMMSNTAHQREVRDLMAAGLNPILSVTGGNGASVTSGSAASSSNPSGASSQADTSLSGAIVSLLNGSLSAMERLADMSTSALSSQAVADKYAAASELAALIGADASRYGAGLSSAATRYAADQHREASHYSANRSFWASRYSALDHLQGTKYAADKSNEASHYSTDTSRDLHVNYPNNPLSAILRFGDALEDGLGAGSMVGAFRDFASMLSGFLK